MSTGNSLLSTIQTARGWLGGLAILAALVVPSFAQDQMPLVHRPALQSDLLTKYPLVGVAGVASQLVAVGWRGAIVTSDDSGRSWQQAPSPVSRDLVAVSMPTAQHAWVVGHGGLVLHSDDAGKSWTIQLDGAKASELTLEYYRNKPEQQTLLASERSLVFEGEAQPFLDVYFKDAQHGYVVGTFNRIYQTQDGGRTWVPLMDKVDNTSELHFYAVEGHGEQVYLAGEQGRVWSLDHASGRFLESVTPYTGTLFGLFVSASDLYTYGMRGSLYRSTDHGSNWEKINLPAQAGISSVMTTKDGALLVVDQSGAIFRSKDKGASFVPVRVSRPMAFFAATALADGRTVLVGAQGLSLEEL